MNRQLFAGPPAPTGFALQLPAWRKIVFLTAALAVGLTGWLGAQDPAKDVPSAPTPATDQSVPNAVPEVLGAEPGEVLTRGPIHEAFAKPVVEDTKEPPIVPKAPPALIEELPPDERPVGENVLWIPGYFAWDEDRLDFIWVSGVYRDAPPGHTWVSGYWRSAPGGSQWVPGFWTTVMQQAANKVETELEFLPEPPVTLEQGPSVAQPSENHFWIPGNWRYVNNKYAWQSGYWSAAQAGWIWVPAHYTWTPQGYVYVQGYWDYSLAQRGLAFAPVYFDAAYYANPVVYRPQVLLRPNFLTVHLWSRPRYAHYYFGDYYGNNYATVGYRPWFSPLVANRAYYDPLFTYYSWQGRRVDPSWNAHVQQRYEYIANHPNSRPPHTYREQHRIAQQPQLQDFVSNVNFVNSNNTLIDLNNNRRERRNEAFGTQQDLVSLQVQNAALTANLGQVVKEQQQLPQSPLKLENVNPTTRAQFAQQAKQFRAISAQRQELAGPRMPGVTTETVAPSTSGNPVTKTVTGDPRTKIGGGVSRLPVVQPVADAAVAGRSKLPAAATNGGVEPVLPGATANAPGATTATGGFPGINKAADTTPAKNSAATDSNIPTDRNPNKLGKNVPPGEPPTGIGAGIVGGSYDPGVAPIDIVAPGTVGSVPTPVLPNGGIAGQPGVNNGTGNAGTNNNPSNGTDAAPSNTPNTTATTVPGQRTPANGAFGQDQGALVPPGQLAPGQQNPEVFNPRVADPNAPAGSSNAPAFNPTIADPNASTNNNSGNATNNPSGTNTTNGSDAGKNLGITGSSAKTTETTVPGQRTPTNGAFGQDQSALVPPGQLAPGQQNAEVFNPRVADPNAPAGSKNAPAFNPKVADPTTSTNQPGTMNSTNNSNTTTSPSNSNTATGTKAAGGNAAGANTGTNGNATDTNTSGTNTSSANTTTPTAGSKSTANTVPGQRTPAGGAFGQDQGALVPPGQLAPGQQNAEVFNPRVADPNAPAGSKNAPTFNPKVADPSKQSTPGASGTNSTTNPMSGNATSSTATGGNSKANTAPAAKQNSAPRGRNPATGPNLINGRPVGGDAGNANPVLGTGPSAGPKINPNAPLSGNRVNPLPGGPGNRNLAPNNNAPANGKAGMRNNPANANGANRNATPAPVGPGGGTGGIAPAPAAQGGAAPAATPMPGGAGK